MLRRNLAIFIVIGSISLGCGTDRTNNGTPPAADAGSQDIDAGATDGGEHADTADAQDDGSDNGEDSDCLQASIAPESFDLDYADDVSVEYLVTLTPEIDGKERGLALLYERYGDASYVGTFELGTGADANFGTCPHCLFIRGDSAERAYFADRGTLTNEENPFLRRLDTSVENLRLIEVAVDPVTRASAPIPDGKCIEVADFSNTGVYPPSAWRCEDEKYDNGVACDCECGAWDPDCAVGSPCLPGDPSCEGDPGNPEPLPLADCSAEEVCASNPLIGSTSCMTPCDWLGRSGCDQGTCVFDSGVGDGDLCLADSDRIAPNVKLGEPCPQRNLQVVCNVVDGFAEGYCGPNNVCRPICQNNDECTVDGETCRTFAFDNPLGYCGPEPTDG